MHHWYVLQVMSAQEKKVKKAIEEQKDKQGMDGVIEEVLFPIEKVSEVKKGEQKIVEKRLWPGYLLVKMELTDQSWSYINEIQGVIGFLGAESPNPLNETEVTEILQDLREKSEKVTERFEFSVGDSVKIVSGVFMNFVGTITKIDKTKGKVSVLVSIFGRDTQVDDLEFSKIEEYSEED